MESYNTGSEALLWRSFRSEYQRGALIQRKTTYLKQTPAISSTKRKSVYDQKGI